MADMEILKALSDAFGPSGFEDEVAEVIRKHTGEFDVTVDAMNNVFVALKSNTGDRPKVMLDAHTDEVGFMVQHITGIGLIGFVNLGGWVTTNIPAHTVRIRNTKGEYVKGIVTSRPPHFMTDAEKSAPLDVESLLIDVGATSREEVIRDFGIQVGDPIAPDVSFEVNEKNGTCFGKAFDNRVGCYSIIATMKALKEAGDLTVDVIGCFAAQEEVGTRGAQVTSQVVKPDLAIVFEGSPADDFLTDRFQAQCVLKNGTQIRHHDASYISSPRFISHARWIADQGRIRYQCAVRRRGSTNAGKIHVSHKAVPVLVLGIPSRYVHTHYNFCAVDDIDSTVSLAAQVIRSLTPEVADSLMNG